MDTYLDFVVGGKHVKTSVAEDQGRDPDWDDTLTLPHTTGDEIKVRSRASLLRGQAPVCWVAHQRQPLIRDSCRG